MHSTFIKLIASKMGTLGQQLRIETCRMLEDWARKQDYGFRNLYPGNHEPYRNLMPEEAIQRKKKLAGLDCSDNQCYKITALTFKDGKWNELKDRNGGLFYFLLQLNEALSPDAGFELLDAYWVD